MRVWAAYSPGMTFAAALGSGLVLWVGGNLVLKGVMTVGELVAFTLYLVLFYDPVGRLHGLNQMLQAARAAGERVFDIIDTTAERTGQDSTRVRPFPERVRGEVVYQDVSFSYAAEKPVLKRLSLHAAPGEMIALVGPTGAGKSTVVNLLPAFYEFSSGRITIDGIDIIEVPLA